MRVLVMSDVRMSSGPDGSHGLGRSAYDIATGLIEHGDEVTLFAGDGSAFGGPLYVFASEAAMIGAARKRLHEFDVILDTGHGHNLSALEPDAPILNRICDLECRWTPPNAVVNSHFMLNRYPTGVLVLTGVAGEDIPFTTSPGSHLAFMSSHFEPKGWPWVKQFAGEEGFELDVIEHMSGSEKWRRLGTAAGLLHPSTADAAPRLPLEAAACGVPTICLSEGGAPTNVQHNVSGYVCDDAEAMAEAVGRLNLLNRETVREWVLGARSISSMIVSYSRLLLMVADGRRW